MARKVQIQDPTDSQEEVDEILSDLETAQKRWNDKDGRIYEFVKNSSAFNDDLKKLFDRVYRSKNGLELVSIREHIVNQSTANLIKRACSQGLLYYNTRERTPNNPAGRRYCPITSFLRMDALGL